VRSDVDHPLVGDRLLHDHRVDDQHSRPGRREQAPVSIAAVLESALGKSGAILFEIVAMIALFASGLANMAASSRLIFSPLRDQMPGLGISLEGLGQPRAIRGDPRGGRPGSYLLVVVGTYIASSTMALIVGMASVGCTSCTA
jgi:hypothetical protein